MSDPSPQRFPILPIVVTCVWGALMFPGGGAAVMSPMMFDAPGSENSHYVWVLFWSVISFPVLCIVSIGASWIAFALFRKSTTALARVLPIVFACVPLVPIAVFAVMILREPK